MANPNVTARVDPEVKEALRRMAARSFRSESAEIGALIIEKALATGDLPEGWRPRRGRERPA